MLAAPQTRLALDTRCTSGMVYKLPGNVASPFAKLCLNILWQLGFITCKILASPADSLSSRILLIIIRTSQPCPAFVRAVLKNDRLSSQFTSNAGAVLCLLATSLEHAFCRLTLIPLWLLDLTLPLCFVAAQNSVNWVFIWQSSGRLRV